MYIEENLPEVNHIKPHRFDPATKFQSFGLFLKEARIKRNVTQGELAKSLGYSSAQFVSNWERGLCAPALEKIPKLSRLLGISKKEITDIILDQTRSEIEAIFKKYKARN